MEKPTLNRAQVAAKAAELVDILIDEHGLSPSEFVTVTKMVLKPSLQNAVEAMAAQLKDLNIQDLQQILNVSNSMVSPVGQMRR